MPRIARVVAIDLPHHITQRGNNRADVFFDDNDRNYYLKTLSQYSQEFRLKIWAYCLMNNHIHLLAIPQIDYSLAKAIGATNLIYTQHVNKKYHRSGRLWQNRFYSCPVDKDHYLWSVIKYIETNPVRVGLVKQPWDYRWSSAPHHIKNEPDLIVRGSEWLDTNLLDEYRQYLIERPDEAIISSIRKATSTGKPLGDSNFIISLEQRLGRLFRPKKPGRPYKHQKLS